MLVVVVLLPLSLPMYDGEFDHGGGGGGCGGPAAAAVAAVEAVEDNLSAKAAGNESVDGRMTAWDDEIGNRTVDNNATTNQRSAARRRWQRYSARSAAAARQLRRWRQLGGSKAVAAA
jgi:hypothetical protein